jgi:hypothetical protein
MAYFYDDGEDLLSELAKANRFTLDELAQNRTGMIATSPMWSLAGQAFKPLYTSAITFGGWLLFLMVIWVFVPGILLRIIAMFMGQSMTMLYGTVILITLGCVGSLALGFLKTGRRTMLLIGDLSQGRAEVKQGRVWASRGKTTSHGMAKLHREEQEQFHYVLNDQYFEVRGLYAFEALAPRNLYRLYYAPKSKLLLSIEPATSASPETAQGASA